MSSTTGPGPTEPQRSYPNPESPSSDQPNPFPFGQPTPRQQAAAMPSAQATLLPASIGDRFLARLIDSGILFGALAVLGICNSAVGDSASAFSTFLGIVGLLVLYGYEFVMIALYGQTVGKRVMKLRVVRLNGAPAEWGPAAARALVPSILSCLSCGLGGLLFYLSPLFDSSEWKRGWYDQIASTVVIRQYQGGPT